MTTYVIDASATVGWLLGETDSRAALPPDFGTAAMVAPSLWRTEVTNAILVAERRKRITAAQGTRLLQVLDCLEVDLVDAPAHRSMEALALFARPLRLTAYDAAYLELAVAAGLPLCALDRGMQAAASDLGVPLAVSPPAS